MKTMGIFLIITGLIFFNACNREEIRTVQQDDIIMNIGYWHNEAVGSVINDDKFYEAVETGLLTTSSLREMIVRKLSEKDGNLFEPETILSNLSWSDPALSENEILPGDLRAGLRKAEGPLVNAGAVFRYLYQKNEIRENLYEKLNQLNKKVMSNGVSVAEILKLSQELEKLSLTGREKSYVEVFNQVLSASSQFWNEEHARIQGDRTVAIIWADAAGGLYGMLCGPVCSIIEGALFSTLVAIQ